MKKINKKWLIIGAGAVLLIITVWSSVTEKETILEKPGIEMTKTEKNIYQTLDNKYGSIVWETEIDDWPGQKKIIKVLPENKTRIAEKLKNVVDIDKWELTVDNEHLAIFKSDKEDNLYINLDDRIISFGKGGITDNYYQELVPGFKNSFKEKFLVLTQKLEKESPNLKIEIIKTYYETIDGQRTVPSEKNQAIIENFEASYINDGWPIFSTYGYPTITASFASNGELLTLKIQNPFFQIDDEIISELKTVDELKSVDINDYFLFRLEGGRDFIQSNQDDDLKEVTITETSNVYLYSPQDQQLTPFLLLKGNALIKSGPVKVTLGIKGIN